jgi:hypothetical protein
MKNNKIVKTLVGIYWSTLLPFWILFTLFLFSILLNDPKSLWKIIIFIIIGVVHFGSKILSKRIYKNSQRKTS